MRDARAVDPRTGAPSITSLAGLSRVAVETVRKLVYGIGAPRTETVERVAEALRLDIRVVSEWAGQHRAVAAPFTLPSEAALLDERERDVITELVRVMTAGRRGSHQNDATLTPGVVATLPNATEARRAKADRRRASKDPMTPAERLAAGIPLDVDLAAQKRDPKATNNKGDGSGGSTAGT